MNRRITGSLTDVIIALRPRYLLLPPILIALGALSAALSGKFNIKYSLLCLPGLVFLHSAVNILNDYHDYYSGIDFNTCITPYNGGSGQLVSGKVSPAAALLTGLALFIFAVPFGIFFIAVRGPVMFWIFSAGAALLFLYTGFLTKIGYGAAELSAGLGLGALPVAGVFYINTGSFSWDIILPAIISGVFVFNLLFLNEFPDMEADKSGGRRTLPVMAGRRSCSRIYAVTGLLPFFMLISGIIFGALPIESIVMFFAFPMALLVVFKVFKTKGIVESGNAQALNTAVVLISQLFLAAGMALSIIW